MVPNCVSVSEQACPHCGGPMYEDQAIAEKQDACYHKVRSRYKVWPSAYASGALVQCRKKGAKNWGNKSNEGIEESLRDGEYHTWTVHFDDGTTQKVNVPSDEFDIVSYFAKKGRKVTKVDYDFAVHGERTGSFSDPQGDEQQRRDSETRAMRRHDMQRLRELSGMPPYCDACDRVKSQCICDQSVTEHCGCDEPDNSQAGEYDFEGDMAKDDLYNIVKAARRLNGMLDDNENMPEWVQSKINKAEDYLDVAADYIEANKARDSVDMDEAKYQGREVQLNKPTAGDVKKFKVYVKDPTTGNVKKVNFGDKTMRIKKSNPARRKSFRARHRCENPGPKTKARYWSCRKW